MNQPDHSSRKLAHTRETYRYVFTPPIEIVVRTLAGELDTVQAGVVHKRIIVENPGTPDEDRTVSYHPHRGYDGPPIKWVYLTEGSQTLVRAKVRTIDDKAAELRFSAGFNLPGCLPETTSEFPNRADAVAYLRSEVEHAYDHDNHPDHDGAYWQRWIEFRQAVDASNDPSDWGVDPGGYVYFVEEVAAD